MQSLKRNMASVLINWNVPLTLSAIRFSNSGGKYLLYCNSPVKGKSGKTCKELGSQRRYNDKCKNDPIWQTYNRAYKTHYARYMKKRMTTAEFEQWSRFASELRDKAEKEEITFEEYYEQIRE